MNIQIKHWAVETSSWARTISKGLPTLASENTVQLGAFFKSCSIVKPAPETPKNVDKFESAESGLTSLSEMFGEEKKMRMINILNKAKEKLEMKIDHDPQTLQDLQVIRNLLLTELDRRLERYKQDLIKIKASDKERKRIKKRKNELKKLRGILMSVSESLERIHVSITSHKAW